MLKVWRRGSGAHLFVDISADANARDWADPARRRVPYHLGHAPEGQVPGVQLARPHERQELGAQPVPVHANSRPVQGRSSSNTKTLQTCDVAIGWAKNRPLQHHQAESARGVSLCPSHQAATSCVTRPSAASRPCPRPLPLPASTPCTRGGIAGRHRGCDGGV